MRSVKELKNLPAGRAGIKGKRILVRVDFNVPIVDGKVQDVYRIIKSLPTIEYLQKRGAKIILISHLSKSEGSLALVAKELNQFLKAKFLPEVLSENVFREVSKMEDGDIVMLENLRTDPGEQGKDRIFALELSKLADIYVNEAFSVSHREDTSIVLLPKILPAYAGLQLEAEIKNLTTVFKNPKRPFLFIVGGAKFSTKLPLVKKYLEVADNLFIGGALASDALDSLGYEVGKSLVDPDAEISPSILKNKKIILPSDVLVKEKTGGLVNKKISDIKKNDTILDIGEESKKDLIAKIKKAKFILWNGPLGKYEELGGGATKDVLKAVSELKAKSIIGGGDLVSVFDSLQIKNDKLKTNLFVSTGGGAMLEFLEKGTLPGIEALK